MADLVARVLVVDDHNELAQNIAEILEVCVSNVRIETVVAGTVENALRKAMSEDFHVALVDLHLADGGGLKLLSQLREHRPTLQGVVITGDASVESAIEALEQGAFGYVLKPFQARELIQIAEKAIDRSRLLRESEDLRQRLEKSERLSWEVIDRVPAFVVALDGAGRIVVWNRQLEGVTGVSREEMFGSVGSHLIAEGDSRRLELKDGGHRSVRWQLATVPQAGGMTPLTYAVGVDVTDADEMQRRIIRAERLAAVGTLAAGLAHEVRNPLNSATLQLQLLERRLAKGKVEEDSVCSVVSIVKAEIGRLDHLVTDFLAFAKPQPMAQKPSDLNAIVQGVVELVGVEASEVNVKLDSELNERVGLVPVDSERFRQVILNLVHNAMEAIGTAGGRISLRTWPSKTEAVVHFEVEDTGPGFDDDTPVFDAFFTTKDKGTGLGLAIAHRIVLEHGGTIGVQSKPGCTRFLVTLPQSQSSSPAENAENPPFVA